MAFDEIKRAKLLLVEDSEADIKLVEYTTKKSKLFVDLVVARTGEEALENLEKSSLEELPDLILLDLNMPGIGGREVLKIIRSTERLKRLPVVVMTSSNRDEEIISCYDLKANCYVQKPLKFEQFSEIINSLEQFWFTIVTLPPKKEGVKISD